MENQTINLLEYVRVILMYKRMIMIVSITAFVISIGISLLLPKTYKATALILPPQQDRGILAAMMAQIGGLANIATDLIGGAGTKSDLYVSMLKSETVKNSIIDRFHLMNIYDVKYRVDMYKKMDKFSEILSGKKDGIVSISVVDKDPKRAAEIANAYVEEVGNLSANLNVIDASQDKIFLKGRLDQSKIDLAKAEEALKNFQTKNSAIDVPEQAKVSIAEIAQLKAQLAALEVQLAVLRQSMTDSNSEVQNLQASIARLRIQIAKMEGKSDRSSIPSVGSIPQLGQEYIRVLREYKIQEAINDLLIKQYQLAIMSESKNSSGVQIIQKAQVPDRKYKPKRSLIVLITTFVSTLLSVLFAFLLENVKKMSQEERRCWIEIIEMAKFKKSPPRLSSE